MQIRKMNGTRARNQIQIRGENIRRRRRIRKRCVPWQLN